MSVEQNEYIEGIRRAIQDECNTSMFYRRLAMQVPGTLCGDVFATASADEYRHAQMLATLLNYPTPYHVTDEKPSAMAICPEDLETAIHGELGAICEYATLARMAPSSQAQFVLLSIIGDEYGHVRLFILLRQAGLCS